MKLHLTLLAFSLFTTSVAQSQTQSATKPGSATATTTRSTSTTTIGTSRTSSVRPTTTSPNRQQELYDQYHGVTKKQPSSVSAPAASDARQASRPISKPAPSRPAAPATPVAATERPVMSDGSPSGIRIGVRGGATYPMYTEKLAGIESVVSFVGGFVVNMGKGTFSFQPELNYARYAVKSQSTFGGSAINVAADQFEIPLFLKIASGSVGGNRFFLNIGPYGAYLASASINGQKASLDGSGGRFSVGAAAGVGAALKAGPGHVTIELRGLYELGTTDSKLSTDSRVINTQATLGYMIPLSGR